MKTSDWITAFVITLILVSVLLFDAWVRRRE